MIKKDSDWLEEYTRLDVLTVLLTSPALGPTPVFPKLVLEINEVLFQ